MKFFKSIYFFVCGTLLIGSCNKTPEFEKEMDADQGLVYIQQAFKEGHILKLKTFPPVDGASSEVINVNYGAMGLPGTDIVIQLEEDLHALDSINNVRLAAGLPAYESFPSDAYTIDKWTLTIPRSQTTSLDFMTFQYYSGKFDREKEYMMAIRIKDASGYAVNKDLKTVYVMVGKLQTVKLSKSGWDITAESEELEGEGPDNGAARFAIDGKVESFWHSEWSNANPPLPLWLKVDMKEPRYISKVGLTTRQNDDRGCSLFKLEGSLNGTDWIILGDNLAMDPENYSEQTYSFSITKCRFLRYTALEGNWGGNDFTFLAEFDAYEEK
ncbi:discoidin domain-containing protein [Flavihumibacter solisilvae]|uniref:F5/8 type C domain-containing protein n=1 Tax=Flavihumibacter solisilvae TaxID=1349421 RepID=A0A0C1L7U3_9BACT|nr:discoidin domain-containing protein [Flavihumibacter solisilvae]KIC96217.1 hypothetical protein OI18_00110 [Flavihumibacter solisilvae]